MRAGTTNVARLTLDLASWPPLRESRFSHPSIRTVQHALSSVGSLPERLDFLGG
jgi:hypothetical protein